MTWKQAETNLAEAIEELQKKVEQSEHDRARVQERVEKLKEEALRLIGRNDELANAVYLAYLALTGKAEETEVVPILEAILHEAPELLRLPLMTPDKIRLIVEQAVHQVLTKQRTYYSDSTKGPHQASVSKVEIDWERLTNTNTGE